MTDQVATSVDLQPVQQFHPNFFSAVRQRRNYLRIISAATIHPRILANTNSSSATTTTTTTINRRPRRARRQWPMAIIFPLKRKVAKIFQQLLQQPPVFNWPFKGPCNKRRRHQMIHRRRKKTSAVANLHSLTHSSFVHDFNRCLKKRRHQHHPPLDSIRTTAWDLATLRRQARCPRRPPLPTTSIKSKPKCTKCIWHHQIRQHRQHRQEGQRGVHQRRVCTANNRRLHISTRRPCISTKWRWLQQRPPPSQPTADSRKRRPIRVHFTVRMRVAMAVAMAVEEPTVGSLVQRRLHQ